MARGDGFVRVTIEHRGKSTSISLDDVLFDALKRRLGGSHDDATRWLRAAVLRVDELRRAGDPVVAVEKAGLSRLVQRIAVQHLVEPDPMVEPVTEPVG